MRLPALALTLFGFLLLACTKVPDDGGDYEVTNPIRKPDGEAPDASEEGSVPPDGGQPDPKPAQMFRGTLAASPVVKFGGPPYCAYEVTLKNIDLVSVTTGGDVTSAAASDTATEKALQCVYAPSPPSAQQFTFKAATKTADGDIHVELAGAEANQPKAALVVDLVTSGASSYDATLHWTRTDQPGTLAWAVTAKMLLSPR